MYARTFWHPIPILVAYQFVSNDLVLSYSMTVTPTSASTDGRTKVAASKRAAWMQRGNLLPFRDFREKVYTYKPRQGVLTSDVRYREANKFLRLTSAVQWPNR